MLKQKFSKVTFLKIFSVNGLPCLWQKKLIVFLLLCLTILAQLSCNTTEPTDGSGVDTTSHNFTWQTWTFGEHSSSTLYDVAIINDTSIWAVGKIYMNDSLGQPDQTPYNAVHWDGNEWSLFRVQFYTICGQSSRTPYPAKAIFTFDNNNIWIAMDGDQVARISGTSQVETMCLPISFAINKLWGMSSNELYAVGNDGNIAYYNGTDWQKVISGTDVDIHDIWGNKNSLTGEPTILAIASFQNYGTGMDLLKLDGLTASKLDTTGLRIAQSSVWFKENKNIYIVGDGVFYKDNLNDLTWQHDETHPLLFKRSIRGNDRNDIMIVGDFGLVSHYNGISWHHYRGNELPNLAGSYYSVSINGNIVTAVGDLDNGQAIILRGNR